MLASIALLAAALAAPVPGPLGSGRTLLHDGWTISPIGTSVGVGTLPLNVAPLGNGLAAVQLSGFGENGVDIVNFESGERRRLAVPKSWLGLAASKDGRTIYVSGAADNVVHVFHEASGRWAEDASIRVRPAKEEAFVAGLALDESRHRLFVCENLANRLASIDLETRRVIAEFPTGADPYAVALSPDGRTAYVSNWGSRTVSILPLEEGVRGGEIAVGAHPTDLVGDPAGRRLFVACALDDAVTIVDLESRRVAWSVSVTLDPGDREGATPTSLALADGGRRLFVANSDNNDVAVIDASASPPVVEGFLPVGRYPTAVALDPDGNLLVVDGKAARTFANPDGPQPDRAPGGSGNPNYVLRRQEGDIRRIPTKALEDLAARTREVFANRPIRPETKLVPAFSRIHHVIYIIKENRTYDQVLGDDPRGNGDPSLVLFGDNVMPNHHALAREFTLLDNFYCNAEVSADGHNWSTAAFANDYVQKIYPQNYSRRGREYDFDGARPIAYPRSGYLWDAAERADLSVRSYGEFVRNGATPERPAWTPVPGLKDRFDPAYRAFDLSYRDVDRAAEWLREFAEFEKNGDLPALEIVHLPNDHTAATKAGMRTPTAMAADNDLALGRIIEAVSRSRYFRDTAVFVVEDDSQNGPDHVDCHRSVAFVVSAYTPRARVDHRMYSTASVVATIEKILGLPPLSQYDERAPLMAFEFSGRLDVRPYRAVPARTALDSRNPRRGGLSRDSGRLDLRREDSAPEGPFNEILYRAVQGRSAPAPRVRFGVRAAGRDD